VPASGGPVDPQLIEDPVQPGLSVAKHLPSTKRVHLSYGLDEIANQPAQIKDIPPEKR
jgi:hypothetical protein